MERKVHIIDFITGILLTICLLVTPVFFLMTTQDYYDTNKWSLLVVTALLTILLWGVRSAITNKISINLTPATWGLGAVTIASAGSLLASSPNKIEALLHPLGPLLYGSLFLISLLGSHAFDGKMKAILRLGLYGTGLVLAVVSIEQFFGLNKILFPNLSFIASPLWTPTGNPLATIAFLFLLVPLFIDDIRMGLTERHIPRLVFSIISSAVLLVGLTLALYSFVPQYSKTTLPLADGWAMMLEVFKNPKQAVFGVGPENFLAAFTTGRLPGLNTSDLWNIRFVTNASFALHVSTTLGIVGMIAMLIFLQFLLPKKAGSALLHGRIPNGESISLFFAIIVAVLLPPSISLVVLFTTLLIIANEKSSLMEWKLPNEIGGIGREVALIALVAVGAGFYGFGRVYSGEYTFYQSIVAAIKNDGTTTYNLQVKAINTVPQISQYHLAYSQTNWALANAVANNAPAATESGQPRVLSDADRQTISTLIQQAIREAKLAVNYAPDNVVMWENLSVLYQNLTGIADGADQWTLAAYQRSIQLDPTNPLLRLRYGATLLGRDSDAATQQFLIATNLKPDYANAHYHLAVAYNERKEYLKTAVELRQALSLVPATATDYERVFGELTEIKKKLTPEELALFEGKNPTDQKPETQLTNPKDTTAPQIEPKLELPAEASPPAAPVVTEEQTPTAIPTATPAPVQ